MDYYVRLFFVSRTSFKAMVFNRKDKYATSDDLGNSKNSTSQREMRCPDQVDLTRRKIEKEIRNSGETKQVADPVSPELS